MRITGILQTIGDITTCENYPQEFHDDLNFQNVTGLLISTDEDTLIAASNLLCATIDIYPHPVDGLHPGECTPENYAHALARLAHTEDHLAREVRSSQASAERCKALERTCANLQGTINELRQWRDEHVQAMHDDDMRAQEKSAAKATAWEKYLDLRKQIRRAAEDKRPDAEVHALMNEALTIAGEHGLDPTVLELEEARRTIAELHQQIALTPKDIADAQRVIRLITRENAELRAQIEAMRVDDADVHALLDKT